MLSTLVTPPPVIAMGSPRLTTAHHQVGVGIDTSSSLGREIVKGILAYLRANTTWRVSVLDRRSPRSSVEVFTRPGCDGIIAQVDDPSIAQAIARLNVPTVDLSGDFPEIDMPVVTSDDELIADMAVEHLLNLGFKSLAVVGWAQRHSSTLRADAFAECAMQRGVTVSRLDILRGQAWEVGRGQIAQWLETFECPTGVFACEDALGQQTLDGCRVAGLETPEDVAVLGVGDDELICSLADPPMSSIVLDNRRIGYEAAKRLHRALEQGDLRPTDRRLAPVEVVQRRSTDALVTDDEDVTAAARFIRENSLKGIKVADVLAAVPMSRRVLESRFRSHFGRTLHQAILGVQLDKIKELLRSTDMSMVQIADRSGFRHVEYMSVVFKREVGLTPSAYREQAQRLG